MGGGSSPVSRTDLSKLTSAAEERLRQLAGSGTHILFACEAGDRKALDSHLARSKVFDKKKLDVTDSAKGDAYLALVKKSSLVVVFTDDAKNTDYLDKVVSLALEQKKQGVHARSKDDSKIPSKATAYRWPSLLWEKLEEMFS